MNTSGVAPGSAPKKAAGATPTISKGVVVDSNRLADAAVGFAESGCQLYGSLSTTTGAAPELRRPPDESSGRPPASRPCLEELPVT